MLNLHQEAVDQSTNVLRLEGEATIEYAEQLHQALLGGLRQGEHLQLNIQQTTSIDFYTIQLICSAHRSSVAWEKELTFHGTPGPAVEAAIRMTGFARKHGCRLCPEGVRCMWTDDTCLTIN